MSYDLSRVLFSIGAKSFTCSEFLEALKFFGVYEDWSQRIIQGRALVKAAEQEAKEIDLEALSEMTLNFRYSEKLLTSEEFSEWLQSVGLEVEDFEAYLKRTYWSQFDTEVEIDSGTVSDREFFSELYFSRSYKSLLSSWLKRLLAWHDKEGKEFPPLSELNEAYKKYEEEILVHFDSDLWLNCYSKELRNYELSFIEGQREEIFELSSRIDSSLFESSLENLHQYNVKSFFRDIPKSLKQELIGTECGSIIGPVFLNENYVLCRIDSICSPSVKDENVLEELHGIFREEIWKTLEVKYVS